MCTITIGTLRPPLILYLDTSSLVKLYVEEPGSEGVRGLRGEEVRFSSADKALVRAAGSATRPRRRRR